MPLLPAERLTPWPPAPDSMATVTPPHLLDCTVDPDRSTPAWTWALAVLRHHIDPALTSDPTVLWPAMIRWLAGHGGSWRLTGYDQSFDNAWLVDDPVTLDMIYEAEIQSGQLTVPNIPHQFQLRGFERSVTPLGALVGAWAALVDVFMSEDAAFVDACIRPELVRSSQPALAPPNSR